MRPLRLPPVAPALERRIERAVARTVVHGTPAEGAVHCAVVHGEGRRPGARGARRLAARALARGRCTSGSSRAPAPARSSGGWPARVPQLTVGRVPVRGLGARDATRARRPAPGRRPRRRAPAAAVARGDVAELAELDLDGHAFAAPRRERQRLRRDPPRGSAAARPDRGGLRAAPHGARAPQLRLRRVRRRRHGAGPRAHAPRRLQPPGAAARAGVRAARARGAALPGGPGSRHGARAHRGGLHPSAGG